MKTNYSDWTPRSFMDEFFSPVKYSYGNVEGQGTKDNPFIIHRQKLIDKVYHGWYDNDGGYHEVLVKDIGEDIPEAIKKQKE
tara:strand:- start:153 stop:398 length:246 start_codon:yes stop_codon:yes gene_type:complete